MSTQFVKNTNKPLPDSELWTVADGWRISGQTGIAYTNLNEIYTDAENEDAMANIFYNTLKEQLAGKAKQSIEYVGHYMVASYTKDGKGPFVYAFPPNRKDEAEKKASYNNGTVPTVQSQQQTQQPFQQKTQQSFRPQQSNTATSSTVQIPLQQNNKPSLSKKEIVIPTNMISIAEDDEEGIIKAEEKGLYCLPVMHVGSDHFHYIHEVTGKRTYIYGKLKTVEIE